MATMTVTDAELVSNKIGKPRKSNDFLTFTKDAKGKDTKTTLIETCNDGKVRELRPSEGETVSVLLNDLRAAAKTIGRSVSINYIDANGSKVNTVRETVTGDDGKSSTKTTLPASVVGFRFKLVDQITRPRAESAAAS